MRRVSFNLVYECAAHSACCGLSEGDDLGALPLPARDRLLAEGWGEGHTSTSHDLESAPPLASLATPDQVRGRLSPPQAERSAGASPCSYDRRRLAR